MSMATQHDVFAERLNRINSGKTSCWTIPGEGMATPKQARQMNAVRAKGKSTGTKKAAHGPLSLLLALIAGFALVFGGEWATLTYLTEDGPLGFDPIKEFGYDFGSLALPAIGSILVLGLMRWKGNARWSLVIGFAAAALFMPDIVQQNPDLFAQYYPSDWINMQLNMDNVLGL